MRKVFKSLPDLEQRLDDVNERVRRARRTLDWRTREARIPLDIQEDFGVSELQGGVMFLSRDEDLQDKVRDLVHSAGYGCDLPERTGEAVGMLKLARYQVVIPDCMRRSRGRLFEYMERYQPHVKIVPIVRNNNAGRHVMRLGSYSFLVGRDFDPEQLRTCLMSSLQLRNEVCWLLAHGERCNRSCIDGFESDEEFRDLE